MSAEVLPSDGGAAPAGITVEYTQTETADTLQRSRVETGPVHLIQARRDLFRGFGASGIGVSPEDGDGTVTDHRSVGLKSTVYKSAAGRASLTITFEDIPAEGNSDASDSDYAEGGTEFVELSGMDVIRDIKVAPYFDALTSSQKVEVQARWDDRLPEDTHWAGLAKTLYRHLAHGQESYIETAYELRRSYSTFSSKTAKLAAANSNTVQALPDIGRLERLVGTLPSGEWLKKPTTVNYERENGWRVSEHYQGAPKWSVVYGGTWSPTS